MLTPGNQRKLPFFGIIFTIVCLWAVMPAATSSPSAQSQASVTAAPASAVTPTGVANQLLEANVAEVFNSNAIYDDYDVYVPYRSDVLDNFSWSLLKQVLQEEKQENVIFSPFSVKLVLALFSEAAGNDTDTQAELLSTLTDIRSLENLRGFYKKILTSLKLQNSHYTLNLATKLYTDWFIEPKQRYAAMLHSFYDTSIERLHFDDPPAAAKTINQWAANVTQGRLRQLVTENGIKDNVMVMANVIYFNGLWRREFNDIFPGPFFRTAETQVRVDYMRQKEYFYYYDSSEMDAKILRLPYKGKKFSMFIVLPNKRDGLDDLVKSLENEQLKRMQWAMEEFKVIVTLPKFKFELNKDLKETLQHLGIRTIFTEGASLPGLARGADVARRLKVSNIFQKAGIDVNERGTEAFAATVVEIENKFGGNTTEFNVNRPFLFFIEEEMTGNIIFAGKVLHPYV